MTETALWTADELVAATGGRIEGAFAGSVNGVSIDSRTVARGDLFAAIKGERMDGHEFAARALKAGAAIAMVSRPDDEMRAAGALLVVDEPLAALERLGRAARARSSAQIIAVTGSVGKTTTKEALLLALAACGPTHASVSSFNNHWGVPLTLARMPREARYGVFEIGMNHPGEITPLVAMVRPHVAIITAIAESHLGHFGSLRDIADAKAEIFSGVEPGGAALITADSEFHDHLAQAARRAGIKRVFSFGEAAGADVHLDGLKLHETCSCVRARVFDDEVCFKLGSPGRHVAMNALAVAGAVALVKADLARALLSLSELTPPSGRGVRLVLPTRDGDLTLIDESYNANPASVRAALALLGQTTPGKHGRRIAILGDMLELGDKAGELHAALAEAFANARGDVLHACGTNMHRLWDAVPPARRGSWRETSAELVDEVVDEVRGGDVVMVKGSLGSRMAPIVKAIRDRFAAGKGN